ncbi:MAG TPA: zinc-dependent peptidase, partial [Bacteroidia bacterium]|nr:zinc-dependent peptidase [Bacteroidia bacterium]
NKWISGAMSEYNKLRAGGKSIFRKYGATNIHEFLSVCTEHFFESPDEFKKEAPEFFEEMCILFNQIPSKNGSAKISVRNALLNTISKAEDNQTPLLSLEASFFRTVLNFGIRLLYLAVVLFILLGIPGVFSFVFLCVVILMSIIKMNNMYFTIKFYDDFVYLQKGFLSSFSTRLSIPYRSLMKMEIFNGNFDNYSSTTVFQFNYFNGSRFIKKIAYSSAIDVPHKKIKELLNKKKVVILWPT